MSSSKSRHQAHVLRAIFIGRERSPAPSLHVSLVMIDGVVTETNDERPLGLLDGLIDLLIGPSALDRLNSLLRRRPSMGIACFVQCAGLFNALSERDVADSAVRDVFSLSEGKPV